MGSSLLLLLLASTAIGLAHVADHEESGHREKRGAPSTFFPRWTMPVPYSIPDTFSPDQKAIIKRALKSIEEKTCVNFVEDSSTQLKLVYELTANKCSSKVGDSRPIFTKDHVVFLGEACVAIGNVQHETAHALGIAHTMMRADRDNYLIVDLTDVDARANFEPLQPINSPDYKIPFEYGSRMMYPPYDYGNGITPVLMPRDQSYLSSMGTAPELTFYDWKMINIHYNCSGPYTTKCSGVSTCQNGGYPHPRDCKRCICGDFYDGQYCEIERGVISLQAGKEEVLLVNKTINYAFFSSAEHDWASYDVEPLRVIKAPKNSLIRITIEDQSTVTEFGPHYQPTDVACPKRVCLRSGVEIADEDLLFTGKKFCCSEKAPTSFVSKSNVIGYRAYSHKGTSFRSKVTFKIEPGTAPVTTTTTNTPPTVPTTTTVSTTTTKPPTVPTTTITQTTTTTVPTPIPIEEYLYTDIIWIITGSNITRDGPYRTFYYRIIEQLEKPTIVNSTTIKHKVKLVLTECNKFDNEADIVQKDKCKEKLDAAGNKIYEYLIVTREQLPDTVKYSAITYKPDGVV